MYNYKFSAPEMVTPETLKSMNLLVETGLVDDHVVDGGLVDEHVVDGLADDHEVVADWQEVVADRPESLGKRSRILFGFLFFFFSVCQGVCLLAWVIVAVSAGRCADYPPCPN
jgi:hypothetical protein